MSVFIFLTIVITRNVCNCVQISNRLKNCARHLLDQYEEPSALYIHDASLDVSSMLMARNVSYLMVKIPSKTEIQSVTAGFVLLTTCDVALLRIWLVKIVNKSRIRAEARIVLLCRDKVGVVFELFKLFWSLFWSNVILVSEGRYAYSYLPITKGGCVDAKPVYVGSCGSIDKLARESEVKYFPNCSLQVHALSIPPYVIYEPYETNRGIEVVIFKFLMTHLKFKPNVTITLHRESSIEAETINRTNQILIGGYALFLRKHIDSEDLVFSMLYDDVALFVPLAKMQSVWRNILFIFEVKVWIATLCSIILIIAAWYGLHGGSLSKCLVYVLAVLLSSVPKQPKHQRLLFLVWSISSAFLTWAYGSILAAVMFKPYFTTQISSLFDIMTSKLAVGGVSGMRNIFIDATYQTTAHSYYYDNYENCSLDGLACYNRLKEGNFAFCTVGRKLMYHMLRNTSDNFYKLPTIRTTNIITLLSKELPFRRRLQDCATHLCESGIVQHLDLYEWKSTPNIYTPILSPVKIEHLSLIFVVHTVALVLAGIVFLFEMFRNVI